MFAGHLVDMMKNIFGTFWIFLIFSFVSDIDLDLTNNQSLQSQVVRAHPINHGWHYDLHKYPLHIQPMHPTHRESRA